MVKEQLWLGGGAQGRKARFLSFHHLASCLPETSGTNPRGSNSLKILRHQGQKCRAHAKP